MHSLGQTQIIIAALIAGLVLLCAFGIYFAIRCAKASNEKKALTFANVNKVESVFRARSRRKESRCLFYIAVYMEKALELYPDDMVWRVYNQIKDILLNSFCDEGIGLIAPYEQRNFIALTDWDLKKTEKKIKEISDTITQCLQKNKLQAAATVGVGYFRIFSTYATFDEAIGRAKKACTDAGDKPLGYVEWSGAMEMEQKIRLEANIESDIDKDRFFFVYQPVIDAKTKKIVAAEVLSRLNSFEDGIIIPQHFLGVIQAMSLEEKFDCYVFEKVCKWISSDRIKREKCIYTINFSRATLSGCGFIDVIDGIVKKYGLVCRSFAVEVLENRGNYSQNLEQINQNLIALRERGMRILIDDFGGSFTSMIDLQAFPMDVIKIDKELIQNTKNSTGFAIFSNLVKTAKEIGVKTVCEGIETETHEQIAVEAGCDMLQGFYYYRPMPVKDFEKLLDEQFD
ncbi:MAG: EAL domain-containing protein [Clostridia bacterium]|nr:EAL domain-containing protein [Clostridia bacterium]